MKLFLLAAFAPIVLYCLHRAAVAAERRGWIYYRKKHGSSGSVGNAFLEVHALFEPAKRHLLEERVREEPEAEQEGDPPKPGGDGDRTPG